MKKMLMIVTALAMALASVGANMSLSDARAQIGAAIADAGVMASVMKQLSAADQVKFVAAVNEAVSKMPGSTEEKTATFIAVNRAALLNAQKGNLTAVLAEVFATVPLESLTVLNESFAKDLFNRSAKSGQTYTDAQFTSLAQSAVQSIAKRVSDVDAGDRRTTFAILMFTRASNGSPADLPTTLAAALPENVRETALKEWIPAALAEGESQSYDTMLADVSAGSLPSPQVVLRMEPNQTMTSLLFDLANGNLAGNSTALAAARGTGSSTTSSGSMSSGSEAGVFRVPFFYDKAVYGTTAGQKGSGRDIGGGSVAEGLPGGVPVTVDPETGKIVPVGPGGAEIPSDFNGGGSGGGGDEPGGYDWQR